MWAISSCKWGAHPSIGLDSALRHEGQTPQEFVGVWACLSKQHCMGNSHAFLWPVETGITSGRRHREMFRDVPANMIFQKGCWPVFHQTVFSKTLKFDWNLTEIWLKFDWNSTENLKCDWDLTQISSVFEKSVRWKTGPHAFWIISRTPHERRKIFSTEITVSGFFFAKFAACSWLWSANRRF